MNNTLKFDGTNNYIEVNLDCPTNNGGEITVEFWNKVDQKTLWRRMSFGLKPMT